MKSHSIVGQAEALNCNGSRQCQQDISYLARNYIMMNLIGEILEQARLGSVGQISTIHISIVTVSQAYDTKTEMHHTSIDMPKSETHSLSSFTSISLDRGIIIQKNTAQRGHNFDIQQSRSTQPRCQRTYKLEETQPGGPITMMDTTQRMYNVQGTTNVKNSK